MWYKHFSTNIDFHPSHHFHFLLNAVQRSSSLINREKRTVRTEFHYLARETQHTRIMLAIKGTSTTQPFPSIHNSEPTPSPLGYKVIGYLQTKAGRSHACNHLCTAREKYISKERRLSVLAVSIGYRAYRSPHLACAWYVQKLDKQNHTFRP